MDDGDAMVWSDSLPAATGPGHGIAYCHMLHMLAVSYTDSKDVLPEVLQPPSHIGERGAIKIFEFAEYGASGELLLKLRRVLSTELARDAAMPGRPLQFKSVGGGYSGCLAFMGPRAKRLLLVSEPGAFALALIDVTTGLRAGYVAGPSDNTLKTIYGVAGTDCGMVAVASSSTSVWLYRKQDICWQATIVIDTFETGGLRLTKLPSTCASYHLVVGDMRNWIWAPQTVIIQTVDVKSLPYGNVIHSWSSFGTGVLDIDFDGETYYALIPDGISYGSVVSDAGGRGVTMFAPPHTHIPNDFSAYSLAFAPGMGLFVRRASDVILLLTQDRRSMLQMSLIRIAWMVAVHRAAACA